MSILTTPPARVVDVPHSARPAERSAAIGAGERVLGRGEILAFAVLSTAFAAASGAALAAWFERCEGGSGLWIEAAITGVFLGALGACAGRWVLLPCMRRPHAPEPTRPWRVAVATTFVPDSEPFDMLEATVRALVALERPHDTWVLDEGDDMRVRALCERLGALHYSRKGRGHRGPEFAPHTKWGNYNAWLADVGYERYDLLTAVDPDHVLEPGFLDHVLGFFEDQEIAYVQAAQAYANQGASLVARGAAEETYGYYSTVQMACHGLGYPVVVGSHNTHRIEALREVGGFAAHEADDLLLTLHYRAAGWRGVYVPRIVGRGRTPEDWNAYLGQQRRWARSVLDLKIRRFAQPSRALSLQTRAIGALHGLSYVKVGIAMPLLLVVLAALLVGGSIPPLIDRPPFAALGVLAAVMLACELFRQRFYLDRRERGLKWRVLLLGYAKWPFLATAWLDACLGRCPRYVVTPKGVAQGNGALRPHLAVVALLAIAWLMGAASGVALHPVVHGAAAFVLAGTSALLATAWWPRRLAEA